MTEILPFFSPFLITFAAQLLLCRFVKHKVFRHASLLVSILFAVLLILLLFNQPDPVSIAEPVYVDSEYWFFGNLYAAFFVMSIVGYGLAWLIYGIVCWIRGRKCALSL